MQRSTYLIWAAIFAISGLLIFLEATTDFSGSPNGIDREGSDEDMPQNPEKREQWWRSVVGPPPTYQQRETAQRHIERQIKALNRGAYRDAGINGWDDRGPDNIGGRIRAIAINPNNDNEIYIGGAAGGVWKSTNGGSTWNESTPSVFAYPVTSLVIDPDNPDIVYGTTGERLPGGLGGSQAPSVGVLKSVNGGASWTAISVAPNNPWLANIRINPENSDILYVAGGDNRGRLYRSDDKGETWIEQWNAQGMQFSSQIWDIEINPGDTAEIYVATWNQVLRSNDSGVSFTSMMGAAPLIDDPAIQPSEIVCRNRSEISICANNPDTVYVLRYVLVGDTSSTAGCNDSTINYSEVWRTGNGGDNWSLLSQTSGLDEDVNILKNQGDYDNIIWADPSDCSRALMGGINFWKWESETLTCISRWQDDINGNSSSGANNSIHADQHMILPDPGYNGNTNAKIYIGNDGGLYKADNIWNATTNSGWSALNSDLNITQLYGVDVSLSGDVLAAGSQDNSYFFTYNGSSNNISWDIYSTGDGGRCAVNKSNTQILYVSTQNGKIYRSTNGGSSFSQELFLEDSDSIVAFIAPVEMDPNTSSVLYTGGSRLWRLTYDGSITVKAPITTNQGSTISTIEIAKGNSDLIWFGLSNGNILKSTDGTSFAPMFTGVDTSGLPHVRINDIAIHPLDHSKVAIALGGGNNTSNIYVTEDAGQNWTNISLGTAVATLSIIWHPLYSDWLYVGTNYGIFASEDGGVNWSITPFYKNGEGPIYTIVSELVWQGDGSDQYPYYLVAATHGRGAWRSQSPIYNKYYVDKDCNPCGLGSFTKPFGTFTEAVEAAGDGTEIIMLSGGDYDEVSSSLLAQRRIKLTLDPGAESSVIIK